MKRLAALLLLSGLAGGCITSGLRPVGPLIGPDGVMPVSQPDSDDPPPARPAKAQPAAKGQSAPAKSQRKPAADPPAAVDDEEINEGNASSKIEELEQELSDEKAAPKGKSTASSRRR